MARVFSSHLSGIRLVLPVFDVKLKRRKKKTQVGNCSGNIFSSSLNACLLFLIILVIHYSFHLVDGEQNSFGWLGRIGRSQRHVQHERRRPFFGCHGQSENSSVSNTLQSAFILRGKPTAEKEVFGLSLTVSKNTRSADTKRFPVQLRKGRKLRIFLCAKNIDEVDACERFWSTQPIIASSELLSCRWHIYCSRALCDGKLDVAWICAQAVSGSHGCPSYGDLSFSVASIFISR